MAGEPNKTEMDRWTGVHQSTMTEVHVYEEKQGWNARAAR